MYIPNLFERIHTLTIPTQLLCSIENITDKLGCNFKILIFILTGELKTD